MPSNNSQCPICKRAEMSQTLLEGQAYRLDCPWCNYSAVIDPAGDETEGVRAAAEARLVEWAEEDVARSRAKARAGREIVRMMLGKFQSEQILAALQRLHEVFDDPRRYREETQEELKRLREKH